MFSYFPFSQARDKLLNFSPINSPEYFQVLPLPEETVSEERNQFSLDHNLHRVCVLLLQHLQGRPQHLRGYHDWWYHQVLHDNNIHHNHNITVINRCGKTFTPPTWFLCATSLNHFSLVLNASVNFIIYLSLGRKFRQKASGTLSKFLGWEESLGLWAVTKICHSPPKHHDPFFIRFIFFSKIQQAVTDCSFRLRCGSVDKDQPSITSANMEQYSASSVMSAIKWFKMFSRNL